MPRFPRPEMAAHLSPLLLSQGVTGDRPAVECSSTPNGANAGVRPAPACCSTLGWESAEYTNQAGVRGSLLSRDGFLAPSPSHIEHGLSLANAIAAAVFGPRGELREK